MTDPRDLSAAEQELLDLEHARYRALEAGDADALAALCHPGLVYTHSNGARDDLASMRRKVQQKVFVHGPIDHPVDRIVLDGSTGIVVGSMRAQVWVNGEERHLDNASLAVWTRTEQGWRLLAYQPTPQS